MNKELKDWSKIFCLIILPFTFFFMNFGLGLISLSLGDHQMGFIYWSVSFLFVLFLSKY